MNKKEKWIYLDLETTGFSRQWDYIIEFAAVAYDPETKQVLGEFHEYSKPNKTIPAVITNLTGITNEKVRFCRSESEVLGSLVEWLFVQGATTIIGHNYKSFDGSFLKQKTEKYGINMYQFGEVIDTLTLARKTLPKPVVPNHKQVTLAEHFKIEYQAHSAIEDVKALIKIHESLVRGEKDKIRDALGF